MVKRQRKLAYVGTKRKISPGKYSDYRLAARARYKRKVGRAPSPAQMAYWTRKFQITKPRVSITRQALRAVAERMAGRYYRKHGKMPTRDQLKYWTRGFQIKGITGLSTADRDLVSVGEPGEDDKYRFTYVAEERGKTP